MNHVIDCIEHEGFVAKIVHDESPDNPMDPKYGDPVGTITYSGSRYTLGTRLLTDVNDRLAIEAGMEAGNLVGMPVFAYIHSGIALQAAHSNPYNCPWDSGQSGVVFCTAKKACDEWGTPEEKLAAAVDPDGFLLSKATKEKALKYMAGEVERFCQYLNGEVYCILIEDERGNVVDSCSGFYGLDYAAKEAKSMVKRIAKDHAKQMRREKRERKHWAARGVVTA